MKTIIKWPGGKSHEVSQIIDLIPSYDRYIEPFFGGGAVFFYLQPKNAIINDISPMLIRFYKMVQAQDERFHHYLLSYHKSFQSLLAAAEMQERRILAAYQEPSVERIQTVVKQVLNQTFLPADLIYNSTEFFQVTVSCVTDKFNRTRKNNRKSAFSEKDLIENLKTGFTSGFYIYFRNIYNQLAAQQLQAEEAFVIANFYFIREYCYGSMFRYNAAGEFNIPYGGVSYNRKNFLSKINAMFQPEMKDLFSHTTIYNQDFETMFADLSLTSRDFIFLDPPYDTEFSDYEGRDFTQNDQIRLAEVLKKTKAQFILVIKNTDFIYELYKDNFRILTFDKKYAYNVRSRNDRKAEHLIITNIMQ